MKATFHADKPRVTWKRSAIKSAIYRVLSWGTVTATAWLILSSDMIGMDEHHRLVAFSIIEAIQTSVLYYLYERLWAHIDLSTARRNNADTQPARVPQSSGEVRSGWHHGTGKGSFRHRP